MVKKYVEVLLILGRTNGGEYWSFNFDDGTWKIIAGKVSLQVKQIRKPHIFSEVSLFVI